MNTQTRISELRGMQNVEAANNFSNGNLWNELEYIIYFLSTYGQETQPKDILHPSEGYKIGYRLDNGHEVWFEGMSIYNAYN